MKENKGKTVMDKVVGLGESQPRPSVGEKRKSISKGVDLGNLPSRRKEKKAKHKSSKLGGTKSTPPVLPVHILDVDLDPKDPPSVQIMSMAKMPTSSQPSRRAPQNLVENVDLA